MSRDPGRDFWAELASLSQLQAVLDPRDTRGAKNRAIDRTHKLALRLALRRVRGRRVLDFGCGTGRLTAWLAARGAQAEGVDAVPEMVAAARRHVPGGTFGVIEDGRIPAGDDAYDAVISVGVLLYFVGSPDLGRMLGEIRRVLRPRGRLVCIEQVTDGDIGRAGPLAAYREAFAAAGFRDLTARPIRRFDSRVLKFAERRPRAASLPLLPALIALEARVRAPEPLTGDRYADYLFAMRAP